MYNIKVNFITSEYIVNPFFKSLPSNVSIDFLYAFPDLKDFIPIIIERIPIINFIIISKN